MEFRELAKECQLDDEEKCELVTRYMHLVLPRFSSVRFSDIFFKLRTELLVQFSHFTELWTELSVRFKQVQFEFKEGLNRELNTSSDKCCDAARMVIKPVTEWMDLTMSGFSTAPPVEPETCTWMCG